MCPYPCRFCALAVKKGSGSGLCVSVKTRNAQRCAHCYQNGEGYVELPKLAREAGRKIVETWKSILTADQKQASKHAEMKSLRGAFGTLLAVADQALTGGHRWVRVPVEGGDMEQVKAERAYRHLGDVAGGSSLDR